MKNHIYKNLAITRIGPYVLIVLIALLSLFGLVGTIASATAFFAVNEENIMSIEGVLLDFTDRDNGFVITLKGENRSFALQNRFEGVITFSEFAEIAEISDKTELFVLKSEYASGSESVDVYGLTLKGETIYALSDGMRGNRDYLYTNFVFVGAILVLSIFFNAHLITKILRLPKHKEVKLSRYIQNQRSDVKPNKHSKVGAILSAIIYLWYPALLFAQIFFINFYDSAILLTVWLWIYAVFLAYAISLAFIRRHLKKQGILLFTEYLSFIKTRSFVSKNEVFCDLITDIQCVFTENALMISFERPGKTQDPAGQTVLDDDKYISIEYADLSFYAEAFFKPAGDMMTVYVIAEFKNISKLIDLMAPENDGTQMREDIESYLCETFLMLQLDQNLYEYIKHFNVKVDNLDNLIENREEHMKKFCNLSFYAKLN